MRRDRLLMILAAGEYQLPAIIKAKEMGLRVLVTDFNPNALGFKFADFYRVVDVRDEQANLKLARQFAIDGVMSIVCEHAVKSVAYIAEQLGLPGLKYEAAAAATNKGIMRKKWLEARLPSPKFFVVKTKEETISAVSKLSFPIIMKPADNAGSRGVTKIEKLKELDFSFKLAKESSLSGQIIIEEFIEGTEITVEVLSHNGQHHILAISSKKPAPILPYCVTIGQVYPSGFSRDNILKVGKIIPIMLNTLGIDSGATHSEIMMTKSGPIPIEIGARGGGFGIFSDIVPFVSGVDIVKECINMALDFNVNISLQQPKAAVLRFFNLGQGRLLRITGLEQAKNIKGMQKLWVRIAPGEMIPSITDGTSRHGHMIIFGNTREEVLRKVKQAESLIKFDTTRQ